MTAQQLRRKIRNLEEEIEEYQSQIRNCGHEVEKREYALSRVRNKRNNFENFFGERKERIRKTSESLPNMSFVSGFQEDLAGFMEGREFGRAMDSYGQAELTLRKVMESLFCKEEELRHKSHTKERELEDLQRKLRNLEREE